MQVSDKCKQDLLFFNELKKQDQDKWSYEKDFENDMFFYYKDKLYNTSDFKMSTSEDYDGILKLEEENYMLIKYLDDDTVCIGVIK